MQKRSAYLPHCVRYRISNTRDYSKSGSAKVCQTVVTSPQMSDDANAIAKLIHLLTDEVNELRKVQDEALKKSIYVGATIEERKQLDDRRARIKELQEKLSKLLGSNRNARGAG